MSSLSERAALLAAVAAAPADDLPRLVLADWLDEHGESARAGYVRAQVELARLIADDRLDDDPYPAVVAAVVEVPAEELWAWAAADGLPVGPPPSLLARDLVGDTDLVRNVAGDVTVGFRRGFVAVVRCPVGRWVRELGRSHAGTLERVEPTDRRPYPHRPREWVWRLPEGTAGGPTNVLPPELFVHMPGRDAVSATYPTRLAAVDALSAACLRFARGRGGL